MKYIFIYLTFLTIGVAIHTEYNLKNTTNDVIKELNLY